MSTLLELGTYGIALGVIASVIFASSLQRMLIVCASGTALVCLSLAVSFSTAPTEPTSRCHDCGEHFGRWIDAGLYVVTGINVVGWWVGVACGWLLRRMVVHFVRVAE
jgi:hypothetical protein